LARPEVTGKAPFVDSLLPSGPPIERKMLTIPEFCRRNSISRAFYYELRKQSLTPREVRDLGRVVRITIEAENEWRAARELASRRAAS
jgi:predicted DNA-binding transcriptional regulator AlpA